MSLSKQPFLHNHQLTISTLSPVHIGCGEDYEPTNYVMRDDCLYHFDLVSAVDAFTEQELHELDRISSERDPLLRLQSFIADRADSLVGVAYKPRPVATELYKKYRNVVGRAANVEQGGRKVINTLEIARTAFNSHNQQPIIPGSSLKGAMRTAILDALNQGRSTRLKGRNAGRELERELLKGGFAEDPLRLLKVGDARFTDDKNSLQPRILFENNIKRKEPAGDKPEKQLLSLMREVLPEFNFAAFTGDLTVQDLLGAKGGERTPVPSLKLAVADVVAACNRFYLKIFQREQKRLRERGCLSERWDTKAGEVLALLEPFFKAQAGMLLRVGRHSGAESVTLDGVRDIKIMQGPGKPPRYQDKATTDWLACEQEKSTRNLLPFGWVFVDLNLPEMQSHREKLAAFMRDASAQALQQQNALFAKVEEQQAVAAEKIRQQQQQEAEQQARKEAEAQAEQQREAELAAMSDEERRVEEINQRLVSGEGHGQGLGSQLAADLALLCEQAADWSEGLKEKLHAVAIEASKKLPINVKKNDKWKARLRNLKANN